MCERVFGVHVEQASGAHTYGLGAVNKHAHVVRVRAVSAERHPVQAFRSTHRIRDEDGLPE